MRPSLSVNDDGSCLLQRCDGRVQFIEDLVDACDEFESEARAFFVELNRPVDWEVALSVCCARCDASAAQPCVWDDAFETRPHLVRVVAAWEFHAP